MGEIGNNPFRAIKDACRQAIVFAAFFSLFVNLLQLAVPLYMMQIFDRVLSGGSVETLALLTVICVVSLIVMAALDIVRTRVLARAGMWIEKRLGIETFSRGVDATLEGRDYGIEALGDLGQLRSIFASNALTALFDSPWVPIYLLVIYFLHPLLGFVATVGALTLFTLALLNEFMTRKSLGEAAGVGRLAAIQVQATARNAEVVDAMGMMPGISRRWFEINDAALSAGAVGGHRAAAILSTSKFARLALQVAVLGAGALLVIDQQLTAGAMIAGSIMMSRALAPVEQAIGTWKQLVAARAAYDRLSAMLADKPRRTSAMRLPDPTGYLTVEDVSLVFPGATKPTVDNVAFQCRPGEAVAIIGPSAAGKSSLARLIIGTWRPTSGHVRLDGADVFMCDRGDIGRHIGYLPQDVELFAGTVRENIARMQHVDPEQIVDAAELAGVHDMILRLPKGYDTEIGIGGAVLSGGQRQRVALARALFGRPRLVVLDEPNANLDSEGEEALAGAITAMKRDGATVVVIAHRPSVLKVVDRVIVMRDGAIEMEGDTAEIVQRLTRSAAEKAAPPAAPPVPVQRRATA